MKASNETKNRDQPKHLIKPYGRNTVTAQSPLLISIHINQ